MSGYIGNIPVPQATQTRDVFTASAGQTSFATSGYTPGFVDVYLNGVKLVDGTDFTATNGSDVVLASGAATSDTFEVVSYSTYEVNNQAFTGDFSVDGTTFKVDSTNKRVGIGTSSPTTALDVVGTVTADGLTVDANSGDIELQWAIGSTHKVGSSFSTTYFTGMRVTESTRNTDIISLDATGVGNINLFTGTSETKRMSVNPSGDISFYEDTGTTPKFFWDASAESLGIGTSSPSRLLDVNGIAKASIFDAGGEGFIRGDASGELRIQAGTTATTFRNNANNAEFMRIDASGNLLVGTADSTLVGRADSARLCIDNLDGEDCVQLKGSGDDHLTIASWVPITGTTAYHIGFGDGTGSYTERGVISTNGSTTTYGITSDYRLKENVVPLQNAANRVFQLKPSRFNFIGSPNFVLDGFLAHEVQEIVPEAVVGKKDGMKKNGEPQYQHFDASKLVPLLTAALQEALGRIETLEAEVAALKGQ